MRKRIASLLAVLLLFTAGCTDTGPPKHDGFVTDIADVLNDAEETALEAKLKAIEENFEGRPEVAILIVKSIGSKSIEDYSIDIARAWGIGKDREDNGLLITIAMEQKKGRLETGSGMEAQLTDIICHSIWEHKIKPLCKEKKYYEGLDAGVDGVMAALGGTYDVAQAEATANALDWGDIALIIFFGIVVLLIIYGVVSGAITSGGSGGSYSGSSGGRWSSSGGGKSGGFSFGGGRFSGGGSSGSW